MPSFPESVNGGHVIMEAGKVRNILLMPIMGLISDKGMKKWNKNEKG